MRGFAPRLRRCGPKIRLPELRFGCRTKQEQRLRRAVFERSSKANGESVWPVPVVSAESHECRAQKDPKPMANEPGRRGSSRLERWQRNFAHAWGPGGGA